MADLVRLRNRIGVEASKQELGRTETRVRMYHLMVQHCSVLPTWLTIKIRRVFAGRSRCLM